MPRKKNPLSGEFPYHIYARCINRDWFGIPLQDVWEIMENYLFFISRAYNIQILSFVLMNNHFHLIARTPELNLSKAMCYFMGETSRRITKTGQRINQTYGSRYGRCLINNYHYFTHAYKYVYRNPVKANLVDRVENYPFSSLYGLLGKAPIGFPVQEDLTLFSSPTQTINWLNKTPKLSNEIVVKRALQKEQFYLPQDSKTRLPHELEHQVF